MRTIFIAVLALLCGLATNVQAAPLRLKASPPLAANNAALPRIVSPITLATRRMNAAFAALDATWLKLVRECAAEGHKDVSRTVTVDRNGPHFLSLSVWSEVWCGGAHGSFGTEPFMYDLKTGRPVNWATLLPRWKLVSVPGNLSDTKLGYFTSPSFRAAYYRAVMTDPEREQECGDVLRDDDLAFHALPSEDGTALHIGPANLSHAVQACGDYWTLKPADLRAMGADPRLIEMVQAAPPLQPR